MRALTVQTIAVHVLLCTAHVLTLFPLAGMVMASFMQAGASGYPPRWLPSEPSLNTGRCCRGAILRGDSELMVAGVVLTGVPVSFSTRRCRAHIEGIMIGSMKGCRS